MSGCVRQDERDGTPQGEVGEVRADVGRDWMGCAPACELPQAVRDEPRYAARPARQDEVIETARCEGTGVVSDMARPAGFDVARGAVRREVRPAPRDVLRQARQAATSDVPGQCSKTYPPIISFRPSTTRPSSSAETRPSLGPRRSTESVRIWLTFTQDFFGSLG